MKGAASPGDFSVAGRRPASLALGQGRDRARHGRDRARGGGRREAGCRGYVHGEPLGLLCFLQLVDCRHWQVRKRGGPLLLGWAVGDGRTTVHLHHLGTPGDFCVRDQHSHVAAAPLVPPRDGHGACLALFGRVVDDDAVVVEFTLCARIGAIVDRGEMFFAGEIALLQHDALLPGLWTRLLRGRGVYAEGVGDIVTQLGARGGRGALGAGSLWAGGQDGFLKGPLLELGGHGNVDHGVWREANRGEQRW